MKPQHWYCCQTFKKLKKKMNTKTPKSDSFDSSALKMAKFRKFLKMRQKIWKCRFLIAVYFFKFYPLTLLFAHDSKILATNGTMYNISCWPFWWASNSSNLISKSSIKTGLFLASVIIPNQWPRFFNKVRSEKFATDLSLRSNT